MKKYIYKIINTNTQLQESRLNALGKQGWELCGVVESVWGYTYYIKKEDG